MDCFWTAKLTALKHRHGPSQNHTGNRPLTSTPPCTFTDSQQTHRHTSIPKLLITSMNAQDFKHMHTRYQTMHIQIHTQTQTYTHTSTTSNTLTHTPCESSSTELRPIQAQSALARRIITEARLLSRPAARKAFVS